MATGSTTIIVYVSAFCLLATMLAVDPARAAPAPSATGDLDVDEREVIVGLAEAIIRVSANGLDASSARGMGKRSNAELVNGLLGMRLGELARAGRR